MGFMTLGAAGVLGVLDRHGRWLCTSATGSRCIKEAALEWLHSCGGAITGGRYLS